MFYQAIEELLAADSGDSNTSEEPTGNEPVLAGDSLEPYPVSRRTHDVEIQCCFGPIAMRSVAVQTPSFWDRSNNDVSCQNKSMDVSSPFHAEACNSVEVNPEEWKVLHDHSYSTQLPCDVIFPTYDAESFNNIPLPPQHKELVTPSEVEKVEINANGHEIDMDVDDDLDGYDNDKDDEAMNPHWQPTDDEKLTIDDDVMLPEEELESYSLTVKKIFCSIHAFMSC